MYNVVLLWLNCNAILWLFESDICVVERDFSMMKKEYPNFHGKLDCVVGGNSCIFLLSRSFFVEKKYKFQ